MRSHKRTGILAGVCLCLCAILLIQSLKLLLLPNIPKLHFHLLNLFFHLACFSSSFFLSKLHYLAAARLLLTIGFTSYLCIAILLWGVNLNIQYYFLLGMFTCLYFFKQHESIQLWITLCFFCGLFIYFQNFYIFNLIGLDNYWQSKLLNINALTLSVSCFACSFWIRKQMNKSWFIIQQKERKTSSVLQKIFPNKFVKHLMLGEDAKLKHFVVEHSYASIIFIDFTQFTPFSRKISDTQLVCFLHHVYSSFDVIVEGQKAIKIKTNGDQYIAAIGLEDINKGAYDISQRACKFAMSIADEFAKQSENGSYIDSHITGHIENDIGIKIGIASGNAISGIIGQLRPAFDLWGNTMNLASRLESTAKNQEIQVCQQTMLYSMHHYKFCPGFQLPLKGLGLVTAHKLLGLK
ncbi:MAG: adenylate cyclase [Glaciecola sp.]|jgi:adenylate cyclase